MTQPVPVGDTCNDRMTIAYISAKQSRFLLAYRQGPIIARAAALAGINRCTVYRWQRCPEFTAAMKRVFQEWIAEHQKRYRADEEVRRIRREQRELELRPAKLANLERTRARKRG